MNKLLELRKKISKKRPAFRQQDSHRRGRLHPDKWRKPKGMHSKIRKNIRGKPPLVRAGFRGPAAVRGLDNKGMTPITLYNIDALQNLDAKTNSIIIGNVGNRKRIDLLKACQNKKFSVLNSKNIDAEIKKITDGLSARKERKKKTAEAKKQAAAPKAAKKEAKPETTDAEEQKKQDQQEMQKVITKRE